MILHCQKKELVYVLDPSLTDCIHAEDAGVRCLPPTVKSHGKLFYGNKFTAIYLRQYIVILIFENNLMKTIMETV